MKHPPLHLLRGLLHVNDTQKLMRSMQTHLCLWRVLVQYSQQCKPTHPLVLYLWLHQTAGHTLRQKTPQTLLQVIDPSVIVLRRPISTNLHNYMPKIWASGQSQMFISSECFSATFRPSYKNLIEVQLWERWKIQRDVSSPTILLLVQKSSLNSKLEDCRDSTPSSVTDASVIVAMSDGSEDLPCTYASRCLYASAANRDWLLIRQVIRIFGVCHRGPWNRLSKAETDEGQLSDLERRTYRRVDNNLLSQLSIRLVREVCRFGSEKLTL